MAAESAVTHVCLRSWQWDHAHPGFLDDREVPGPIVAAFENRYRSASHVLRRGWRNAEQDDATGCRHPETEGQLAEVLVEG